MKCMKFMKIIEFVKEKDGLHLSMYWKRNFAFLKIFKRAEIQSWKFPAVIGYGDVWARNAPNNFIAEISHFMPFDALWLEAHNKMFSIAHLHPQYIHLAWDAPPMQPCLEHISPRSQNQPSTWNLCSVI